MTETGMSLGTPHYMSPEQAMGEREITRASDVYALGCVTLRDAHGRAAVHRPDGAGDHRAGDDRGAALAHAAAQDDPAARRGGGAHRAGEAAGGPLRDGGAVRRGAEPARRGHRRATGRAPRGARRTGGDLRARALALAPWIIAPLALAGAAWGWRGRSSRQGTSWQYITFGDGLAPTTNFPSLALSPDGTSLVVRAASRTGCCRSSAEASCTPFPIRDRAVEPPGVLARRPVGGVHRRWAPEEGPARRGRGRSPSPIRPPPPFGGETWLDDGTLIYVGPTLSHLSRVSAAGGRARTCSGTRPSRDLG